MRVLRFDETEEDVAEADILVTSTEGMMPMHLPASAALMKKLRARQRIVPAALTRYVSPKG